MLLEVLHQCGRLIMLLKIVKQKSTVLLLLCQITILQVTKTAAKRFSSINCMQFKPEGYNMMAVYHMA